MNDYVPTNYQKKAFLTTEEDGEYYLGRTSQPFPKKSVGKALQYSIAKWTVICELLERDINIVCCGETTTCALCSISTAGCKSCPIFLYTGKGGCENTPYKNWVDGDISDRLGNAREELAFLQKVYRWWMMRDQ